MKSSAPQNPNDPSRFSDRELLENAEWRLEEAACAFYVMQAIYARCNPDISAQDHKKINALGGFWHPIAVGLQSIMITGIASLVESRNDSATIEILLRRIRSRLTPESAQEINETIEKLRAQYLDFRHKLFAHNHLNRSAVAASFDTFGFTWDSVEKDLLKISYALKVMWHAVNGRPTLSHEEAGHLIFPHTLAIEKAKKDAKEALNIFLGGA